MTPRSSTSSFPDTQWSSVLGKPEADRERWRTRFGSLFEAYRQPIASWFQAATAGDKGDKNVDDLCQAFFVRLIERDVLAAFEPRRGRFRHFLKGALRNFLREHWRFQRAQRRCATAVDLDTLGGDDAFADRRTEAPDLAFDRAFAQMVVQRALLALHADCRDPAQQRDLELFAAHDVDGTVASYEEAAARFHANRDWVKNHLTAMRARFQAALLAVLHETSANPGEALACLRELLHE